MLWVVDISKRRAARNAEKREMPVKTDCMCSQARENDSRNELTGQTATPNITEKSTTRSPTILDDSPVQPINITAHGNRSTPVISHEAPEKLYLQDGKNVTYKQLNYCGKYSADMKRKYKKYIDYHHAKNTSKPDQLCLLTQLTTSRFGRLRLVAKNWQGTNW